MRTGLARPKQALGLFFVCLFSAAIALGTINFQAKAADTNCQFFSETGFTVCGKFLNYWKSHGGLEQQGYPISGEFNEQNAAPPSGDGKIHRVQYFQRARFEEHLENAAPNDVLLGLLGTEQNLGKTPPAGQTQPIFLTVRNLAYTDNLNGITPKDNYRIAVVDLLMVNTTGAPQFSHSGYFTLTTIQDFDYVADKPASDAVEKPMTPLGYVGPGQRSVGQIAFVIPNNETPSYITYSLQGYSFKATTPSSDCQLFTETGFSICGRFLQYWKENGGLAQQGYPISNVFDEQNAPPPAGDGKTHQVQYFQRARFESHPENSQPYDVLLGLLGAEQYQAKYSANPPVTIAPTQPPPAATPTPTQAPAAPIATPKPAQPTPVPTQAPVQTSGVKFVSVQGNSPGRYASVTVQTSAGAQCDIDYYTPKGTHSTAAGLVPKTANGSGLVSWTWLIGGNTTRGTGEVDVTCNGVTGSTNITIG